ncbi:MAG TPA: hypothetical protein VIJ86_04925 [Acidimicrobiales bacterium]
MNFTAFTVAMGWLAVVLSTFSVYVQSTRLRRHGVDGVSLTTWTLFFYLGVFWIIYGIDVHSWQLVVGGLVAVPFEVSLLVGLRPWSRPEVVVRCLVVVVLCCLVPAWVWGWTGAVIGAGVTGTLMRAPQLVRLLRGGAAAGVSASSWTLAVTVSALWVVYYTGAHLWAVLAVTAFNGGVSLVIAVLSNWRHRSSPLVAAVAVDLL